MALVMQYWAKTQEGVDVINSQKIFCLGGKLWQGFRGQAITVYERQITDKEIENAQDIDGTISEVWNQRRLRLEGRLERKATEYDKRRAGLRGQRNEIMSSMKQSADLGIPPSPDDRYQIEQIDKRMERLRIGGEKFSSRLAKLNDPETAEETFVDEYQCNYCQDLPPKDHKSPKKWLRMHKLGKHKKEMIADGEIKEKVAS